MLRVQTYPFFGKNSCIFWGLVKHTMSAFKKMNFGYLFKRW